MQPIYLQNVSCNNYSSDPISDNQSITKSVEKQEIKITKEPQKDLVLGPFRTSRSRLARRALNSKRRSSDQEQRVLKDIINYESFVENIKAKNKLRESSTSTERKKISLNDENYNKVYLEVLRYNIKHDSYKSGKAWSRTTRKISN